MKRTRIPGDHNKKLNHLFNAAKTGSLRRVIAKNHQMRVSVTTKFILTMKPTTQLRVGLAIGRTQLVVNNLRYTQHHEASSEITTTKRTVHIKCDTFVLDFFHGMPSPTATVATGFFQSVKRSPTRLQQACEPKTTNHRLRYGSAHLARVPAPLSVQRS